MVFLGGIDIVYTSAFWLGLGFGTVFGVTLSAVLRYFYIARDKQIAKLAAEAALTGNHKKKAEIEE
jgi:hypothetical protein